MTLALDRLGPSASARSAFVRSRKAEETYARQLRRIAKVVGDLVSGMWRPDDPAAVSSISEALTRYSRLLEPWAASVGERMVTEVAARDGKAWKAHAAKMGRLIGREIGGAPTGELTRRRLADQVALITSLPTEAAERVHRLTLEGLQTGARADLIAREIMRSGEVTASRATLIARTEVGRTATEFTRARAEHIGCTHFIWRTVGDSDVRSSHRRLNGKAFRFDDPPECDPGHRALPGAIWNCRCIPEPILPEVIE